MRQDATVIGLVGLAHASSHFGHLLLPLLFPVFMKEFGLSFAELGFLMTVFFVVSGTGQATAGFVVDRIGARPALFGAFGFFIAACLVGANANGYASLMVVAVLAGLGNCTFHPVDFTILNQRVSAPRLGHAFSAHGLTGNLGWALAPVFFAGITALAGWANIEQEQETDSGYERTFKEGGRMTRESWNRESQYGERSVVIGDRFTVTLSGTVGDADELADALGQVDLDGLEELRGEGVTED
mgnify:CR=1 FL=1